MKSRYLVYSLALVLLLLIVGKLLGLFHKGKWWLVDLRNKLPVHPDRKYNRRHLSQIDTIVVHHTAGPVTQTPFDIADYHTGANHICDAGCPGIAYHFLMDRSGMVYQVNDLETVSYHVSGANTKSVGISLIGNYSEIQPTRTQRKRLKQIIRHVEREVGQKLALTAHRDYKNTECPGKNIVLQQA